MSLILAHPQDMELGEAFEDNQNIMIRLQSRMVASDPEVIRRETSWLNENWNISPVSVEPKYQHLDIITLVRSKQSIILCKAPSWPKTVNLLCHDICCTFLG